MITRTQYDAMVREAREKEGKIGNAIYLWVAFILFAGLQLTGAQPMLCFVIAFPWPFWLFCTVMIGIPYLVMWCLGTV